MKAVITGGGGFIGSHLVYSLLHKGIAPIIYDNFSTGNLENLKDSQEQIEVISGDVRDLDTLQKTLKNADWLFHLGTLNVLWAALQAKVSRVIIATSSSVYGDIHQPPLQETYLPDPKSPYAATKLTAEALAHSFYYSYGLETVCLRYFNVYGLRQRADSDYAAVIPRFVECYQQQKSPQIYGTGKQSRDFIHVSDVARANILAASLPSNILEKHRVFNIGTGNKTNLLQLLDLISMQTNYYLNPTFLPSRQGEIEHSCADITLAQEKLGFQPLISLEEGIKSLL
jgi:UDP-glucose 4-epimerase